MFRIASRISSRALVTLSAKPSPISFRSFNTGLALDKSLAVDDVVRMSNYALRQARSEKSGKKKISIFQLKIWFFYDPFVCFVES
jgi:hypothetical protein